jgi:hypothetical protein
VERELVTRRTGESTWCFDRARKIRPKERDYALRLDALEWPGDVCPDGWMRGPDHLYRYIKNCPETARDGSSGEDGQLATPLRESLLRFPSAPIHGVQRFHEYHNTPPTAENMHTYRILTSCTPPSRISRIFLFHNGLNELDRMGLYYQLASHIIASHVPDSDPHTEGVACVLRPFPGHLTRAPFAQFAEEPLHRYLWDGSYLFSQFLRYMIETQWFLSAAVKRSRYRSPSGAELLLEKETPEHSRLKSECLANEIQGKWEELQKASARSIKAGGTPEAKVQGLKAQLPEQPVFRKALDSLRDVLKLPEWPDLGGELVGDGYGEEPSLHVVGYSLGGFTAQSVFMSWPFVVSSCATLLSGGALRELSPTAFADPEEWQTVLHSLRYELDEGMLNNRFHASSTEVAGLDRQLFHYLQRTFYEVFQQEYPGSYESRVEAFRQRMLFVVGGNDPIVRPDSVLDSAPSGGMNLLEIGGLGHFLGNNPKGDEEKQQREFWLPEVGSLMGRFAAEAARLHSDERPENWLDEDLEVADEPAAQDNGDPALDQSQDSADEATATQGKGDRIVKLMSDRERLELSGDGALPSAQFGACLNDLLARQDPEEAKKGHLFVLRNEVPTLLLPSRAVQRRARALYHDDQHIAMYCREVKARADVFEDMTRTTVVLPWNAHDVMRDLDPTHRFPSQAETAVGQIADEITFQEAWPACEATLATLDERAPGAVRVFDGRKPLAIRDDMDERAAALLRAREEKNRGLVNVPSLPDCWLWMTADFLEIGRGATPTVREEHEALVARTIDYEGEEKGLAKELRNDNLRLVTVSRARYNPRFRGKLVFSARAVQQVLLHVALCLASSYRYAEFDLEQSELRAP